MTTEQKRTGLTALAITSLAAVAAAGLFVAARGPSLSQLLPSSPQGNSWTHRELAGHLAEKGVFVAVEPTSKYRYIGTPAYLVKVQDSKDRSGNEKTAWLALAFDHDYPLESGGAVLVTRCSTGELARETAGSLGGAGFHWGRFLFTGNHDLMIEIQRVLR